MPRWAMRAAASNLEAPVFKGSGVVIDLLRDRAFTASGLGTFAAGWFTFGLVEWSSGANAGRAGRGAVMIVAGTALPP